MIFIVWLLAGLVALAAPAGAETAFDARQAHLTCVKTCRGSKAPAQCMKMCKTRAVGPQGPKGQVKLPPNVRVKQAPGAKGPKMATGPLVKGRNPQLLLAKLRELKQGKQ